MRTEFGIHHRLESCVLLTKEKSREKWRFVWWALATCGRPMKGYYGLSEVALGGIPFATGFAGGVWSRRVRRVLPAPDPHLCFCASLPWTHNLPPVNSILALSRSQSSKDTFTIDRRPIANSGHHCYFPSAFLPECNLKNRERKKEPIKHRSSCEV